MAKFEARSVLASGPGASEEAGLGLVAANGPDPGDLERQVEDLRRLLYDLRSSAGAVRMAVQMLAGPLRRVLGRLDARDRITVESVLDALETSTKQVCDAVTRGGTPPPPAPKSARLPDAPRPSPPIPAPPTPVLAPPRSEPGPSAGGRSKKSRATDLAELLARLEVMTVTRSHLPALLAVDTDRGLKVRIHGADLLRALGYLVDNALEASARANAQGAPWTVEVRAYADPLEVLGDEIDVVIEVRDRGCGFPDDVAAWVSGSAVGEGPRSFKPDRVHGRGLRYARELAAEAGGSLQVLRRGEETVVRMRLPQPST